MKIYIDGKFYPKEEAKVSVFDHGYLYGDGIYETLRAYNGKVFEIEKHTKRLFQSAAKMALRLPLDENGFHKAINDSVLENNLLEAYIRVSVSRGVGAIGLDPDLCPEPTTVIIAKQFEGYPAEMFEKGLKVAVVNTRRNHPESLDPAIKSTNCLNTIFAKMEAKRAGAYEGILLNHSNMVAEGTVSNIFIVKSGKIITPPLIAGILEGVTRDLVIRLAHEADITLYEELFTEVQLWQADEAFITNTTMEVMPVTRVDDHTIAGGSPGAVTKRLMASYRQEVIRCLGTP